MGKPENSSSTDKKQINAMLVNQKFCIMRCNQALVHASHCKDSNCGQSSCGRMKRVIMHVKTCKRRTSGGCVICKQLVSLSCYHARTCREPNCPVPWCYSIKRKIKHKKQQSQQQDMLLSQMMASMTIAPENKSKNTPGSKKDVNAMVGAKSKASMASSCAFEIRRPHRAPLPRAHQVNRQPIAFMVSHRGASQMQPMQQRPSCSGASALQQHRYAYGTGPVNANHNQQQNRPGIRVIVRASASQQRQQSMQGCRLRRVIRIPQSQLNQAQQPVIINARALGQNGLIHVQRLLRSLQGPSASARRSQILSLIGPAIRESIIKHRQLQNQNSRGGFVNLGQQQPPQPEMRVTHTREPHGQQAQVQITLVVPDQQQQQTAQQQPQQSEDKSQI